jgi:hypothetical protein
MLVPATAEDLKSAGKITVSPNLSNANNGNSVKAVQIKVMTALTARLPSHCILHIFTLYFHRNASVVTYIVLLKLILLLSIYSGMSN